MTTQRNGNRRKNFKVQRQRPPKVVLIVFIGLPALAILILLGMIMKNLLSGGGDDKPKPPDPTAIMKEADQLYKEGKGLYSKVVEFQNQNKDTSTLMASAMKKLQAARNGINTILEKIKADNNGEIPPAFRGYVKKMGDIQQLILDLVKRMNM